MKIIWLFAALAMAQERKPDAELRAAYWQASAEQQNLNAQWVASLTPQQKQISAKLDQALRNLAEKVKPLQEDCAKKGMDLDQSKIVCVAKKETK